MQFAKRLDQGFEVFRAELTKRDFEFGETDIPEQPFESTRHSLLYRDPHVTEFGPRVRFKVGGFERDGRSREDLAVQVAALTSRTEELVGEVDAEEHGKSAQSLGRTGDEGKANARPSMVQSLREDQDCSGQGNGDVAAGRDQERRRERVLLDREQRAVGGLWWIESVRSSDRRPNRTAIDNEKSSSP